MDAGAIPAIGDSEAAGEASEKKEELHTRVCAIRRSRATFVSLPAFGGSMYNDTQLNKAWQDCSLGAAYSQGVGEHRVIVLSAKLFPPALSKVANTI